MKWLSLRLTSELFAPSFDFPTRLRLRNIRRRGLARAVARGVPERSRQNRGVFGAGILSGCVRFARFVAQEVVQPARIDRAGLEIRSFQDSSEQADVGLDSAGVVFAQGALH